MPRLRKVLFIKLRALGDTVLMSSAIRALHEQVPAAEIHALVPARWAAVLDGLPGLARTWEFAPTGGGLARTAAALEAASRLRFENFDAVVNLHASPTSAWIARWVDAPVRSIHFHGHTDANRFSNVEIPGKGTLKPILERDLDAVRALGLTIAVPPATRIALHEEEREHARHWLRVHGLRQPLLALGLGASRPTKTWPTSRFAALAKEWAARTGGSALALAAPNETSLLRAFEADVLSTSDSKLSALTHSPPTVRELAALLSEAAIFAGNDSGPKHVAVAVGTPTVTVFGPEHPFEWHPYDPERHQFLFREGLNCRREISPNGQHWCGIPLCTVEGHRCMEEISVTEVIRHCFRLAGVDGTRSLG
jgi:ADP-heptose:LPS heptosyltransferase